MSLLVGVFTVVFASKNTTTMIRVQLLYFQLLSKMIKVDGDYLHGQSLSAFCAPRNHVTLDYILLIL